MTRAEVIKEIENTNRLIETHSRRKQLLEQQRASYGLSADPAILIEIENIETELAGLKAEKRRLEAQLETLPEEDSEQSHTPMSYVQFTVQGDINRFDETGRSDLISQFSKLLDVCKQSIQIQSDSSSNIQVVIEMPAESANELIAQDSPTSIKLRFPFSVKEVNILTDKQRREYHLREARRFITERCLVAADVDKTLIDQSEDQEAEKHIFQTEIAPKLIKAAQMHAQIAAITGNSMHQLASRFFSWVISEFVHNGDITPLANFHLFCNSGGIYVNFDPNDHVFKAISQKVRNQEINDKEVIKEFTLKEKDRNEIAIHPRFIDTSYLKRTAIPEQDIEELARILEEVTKDFQRELIQNVKEYRKDYLINPKNPEDRQEDIRDTDAGIMYYLYDKNGQPMFPRVDTRPIRYGENESYESASVQITVSPILSFRHARKPAEMFGWDFRSKLTKAIQSKLDRNGFSRYVARPGGRTSIDITLEKVDKAYAIEFLIDRLNLHGSSRMGGDFGSNAIYFGDEVIVGDGNDYSVTRIPGLLVFAVNKDRDLVPSLSRVFVPSAIFDGPIAVAEELTKFISESQKLLEAYCRAKEAREQPVIKTAVEALKEKIFVERIKNKINNWDISSRNVSPEDLEIMHILITLLCRDDPIAHQWLSILVDQLNAIMTYLEESNKKDVPAVIKAIGHSYDIR